MYRYYINLCYKVENEDFLSKLFENFSILHSRRKEIMFTVLHLNKKTASFYGN